MSMNGFISGSVVNFVLKNLLNFAIINTYWYNDNKEFGLFMNVELYRAYLNCLSTNDEKGFQDLTSKKKDINEFIITLFKNREDVNYKDNWNTCRKFLRNLPQKTKIIGEVAASLLGDKRITEAVTLINILQNDNDKEASITQACQEAIKTSENLLGMTQFISISLSIVTDREKLITTIFSKLSTNNEIQDRTYQLMNRFFDPKDTTTSNRILAIIQEINKTDSIDSIKSKELRTYYFIYDPANELKRIQQGKLEYVDLLPMLQKYSKNRDIILAIVSSAKFGPLVYLSLKNKEMISIIQSLITDREIAFAAVKNTQPRYQLTIYQNLIPDDIKNDAEFFKEIWKLLGNRIHFLPSTLRKDQKFLLDFAANYDWWIVMKDKWNDQSFILEAFQGYAKVQPQQDRKIVLNAVYNGLCLQFASDTYKSDFTIASKAVRNNMDALQFVSEEIKEAVVLEIIKSPFQLTPFTLKKIICHAGDLLKKTEFLLKALETNAAFFFLIPEDYQINKKLLLKAIKAGVAQPMPKVEEGESSSEGESLERLWKQRISKHRDKSSIAGAIVDEIPHHRKNDEDFGLLSIEVYGYAEDPEISLAYDRESCLQSLGSLNFQATFDRFPRLRGDKPFLLKAAVHHPGIILFADWSKIGKGDPKQVVQFKFDLLKANPETLMHIPQGIWDARHWIGELKDKTIAIQILKIASEELNENNEGREVPVFYSEVLTQLSDALRKDRSFLIEAIKIKFMTSILEYSDPSVWDDQFMIDLLNAYAPESELFQDICINASRKHRTNVLALLKKHDQLATSKWRRTEYDIRDGKTTFYEDVISDDGLKVKLSLEDRTTALAAVTQSY